MLCNTTTRTTSCASTVGENKGKRIITIFARAFSPQKHLAEQPPTMLKALQVCAVVTASRPKDNRLNVNINLGFIHMFGEHYVVSCGIKKPVTEMGASNIIIVSCPESVFFKLKELWIRLRMPRVSVGGKNSIPLPTVMQSFGKRRMYIFSLKYSQG